MKSQQNELFNVTKGRDAERRLGSALNRTCGASNTAARNVGSKPELTGSVLLLSKLMSSVLPVAEYAS